MNVLTFDVEEWFHLLGHSSTKSEEQWGNYEVRIHENMERIFRILDETNTKATFFVIGWVAKKYPEIVRRIAEKYEIGCHTLNHQLVWEQSRREFRDDVESSIKLLEDISGKKVRCFRAPGFSITEAEGWAFEVLADLGIEIDASVFPAKHAHGGMASFAKAEPAIVEYCGVTIKEFPISFKEILGKHIIYSGGGYFRLFPYSVIKMLGRGEDYLMSYIHPRDLDAGQPIIKDLPLKRKFKSYVGLGSAEKKLHRFLTDFDFCDIRTAEGMIDWDVAQRVSLKMNVSTIEDNPLIGASFAEK